MAILSILTRENDESGILTKVASPVAVSEIPGYEKLVNDMLDTTTAIGAVGLAAPQVGYPIQLFVLEDGTVCFNPGTVMGSGKVTSHAEGCLSVPGKRYNIKRIRNVILRGLDREGKPQTLKPKKKLYAIAIQHELDHLRGVLVCDRGEEV